MVANNKKEVQGPPPQEKNKKITTQLKYPMH